MIRRLWGSVLSHFQRRKAGYCAIPDAVLADLAKFCRAAEPCWDEDPRRHALLEGRREVWLRIQRYRQLPAEELIPLAQRATIPEDDYNG